MRTRPSLLRRVTGVRLFFTTTLEQDNFPLQTEFMRERARIALLW
jgi:hypothetical protein